MSLLNKLLEEIDSGVRARTAETILRAFQIMEERQAALVAQIKRDPSKLAKLQTYKEILRNYAKFKILWHRWLKKDDYYFPRSGDNYHNDSGGIQAAIRRHKFNLMATLLVVQEAYPGITYRELNKLSFTELAKKWAGVNA